MTFPAVLDIEQDRALRARLSAEVLAASVIIVDDQDINLEFMSLILRDVGFADIRTANNGLTALELIEERAPDLLILDIMMPIMSGIDLCRILRERPAFADLPILVQTGLCTVHDRVEIFRAGATDLILKPINGLEMVARVGLHIERTLLIDGLTQTRNRLVQELSAAQAMQLGLLPSAEDQQRALSHAGLDIASAFVTSSELGGDVWGILQPRTGCAGVFIADFAGHGVQAALNTFRLHTLVQDMGVPPSEPGQLLTQLNERLRRLLPSGQFATMTCCYVDAAQERLFWSAAGSPPFLLRTGAHGWTQMDCSGLPLGILAPLAYETRTAPFPTGSALFLYSDALAETRLRGGQRLDDEGVAALARKHGGKHRAQPMLDGVMAEFQSQLDSPVSDDLTAVVLCHAG